MTDKNYYSIIKLPVVDMTIGDIVEYLDIIAKCDYNGNDEVRGKVSEVKARFMADALYNVYTSENKGNASMGQQIELRAECEKDTDEDTSEAGNEDISVINVLKYGYWESVVMGLKQIKQDFLSLYRNPSSLPYYLSLGSKGTLIKTSCGELTVFYCAGLQSLYFSIRLLDETYSTSFDAEYQSEPHTPYTNIEFWLNHKDNIMAKFDELIKQVKERH